jgi:hypothetical protein
MRSPIRAGRAAIAVAGIALPLAGCSARAPRAATPPTAVDTAAVRSLHLAAEQLALVNSLSAAVVVRSGTAGGVLQTGVVSVVVHPANLTMANFAIGTGRKPGLRVMVILTKNTIYLNDPALAKKSGKAWVKVRLSQISSRSPSVSGLFQNLEGSNLLNQARLFTASSDAHVVGTAKINGVATTEYAGSYTPLAAMARLSPALRRVFGPVLSQIGPGPVRFLVWIDGQHLIRKAIQTETATGHTTTTTFVVTAINQPVRVSLPGPRQVAAAP